MQSTNINSYKPLSELIGEIIDLTRGNVSATVSAVTSDTIQLVGDFSKFIFSDNPSNHKDKQLQITFNGTTVEFINAKLQIDNSVIVDINSNLPLSVNDVVSVVESDPYYFQGNEYSTYLLEKAMPAIMLLSPHGEDVDFSSSYANAVDGTHKIQLVIADFSDDYNENDSYISQSKGFLALRRTTYVEKPLRVRLDWLMREFRIYRSEVGGVSATIQILNSKAFFVPFLGKQYPQFKDLEAENISGWVWDLTLKVSGQACLGEKS